MTSDDALALLSGIPAETGERESVTVAPPAYAVDQRLTSSADPDLDARIAQAQSRLAEIDRERDEIRAQLQRLRDERDGW